MNLMAVSSFPKHQCSHFTLHLATQKEASHLPAPVRVATEVVREHSAKQHLHQEQEKTDSQRTTDSVVQNNNYACMSDVRERTTVPLRNQYGCTFKSLTLLPKTDADWARMLESSTFLTSSGVSWSDQHGPGAFGFISFAPRSRAT